MNASITTHHDLKSHLLSLADPQYAAFSAKLIPNLRAPMLGVRIPQLRQLAKQLARANAERSMDVLLTEETFEEVLLKGLILGYTRMPWPKWAERVAAYVPLIDNWAVCDTVCASLTLVRHHRSEGLDWLLPYAESESEFGQRFAVVMLMNHYLCDDWIDQTLEVIKKLRPAGYYAAMAAGWALQRAFGKWPERIFGLLHDTHIAMEIRRLARKKLLESRCTPQQWRKRIKDLLPE